MKNIEALQARKEALKNEIKAVDAEIKALRLEEKRRLREVAKFSKMHGLTLAYGMEIIATPEIAQYLTERQKGWGYIDCKAGDTLTIIGALLSMDMFEIAFSGETSTIPLTMVKRAQVAPKL